MTLSSLGLGAVTAWWWLTFLEGHLFEAFPEIQTLGPRSAFLLFTFFHSLTLLLTARCVSRVGERPARGTALLGALLSSAALAPLFCPGHFTSTGPAAFTIFLGALGATALMVLWCWKLSEFPPGRCALLLGCANVLASLLVTLFSWLPREPFLWLTLALPFLGALLWSPPAKGAFGLGEALPLDPPGWGIAPFSPKLALRFASFFLTCSILHAILLSSSSPELQQAWKMTEVLYSAASLATGLLILYVPGTDLRNLYRWAQPLLGLGFAFLLLLGSGHPFLPVSLLQIGYGIFGTYSWVLISYLAARAGRDKALSVVARGQFIVAASVLAGTLLTERVLAIAQKAGLALLPSLSLLGIVLLFLAGLAFDDDRETFAGYDLQKSEIDDGPPRELLLRTERLDTDLTRQESRVALLVVEKRSNAEICCALNITNNTVRTHLKNIYRKTGVSSREELQERFSFLEQSQ